jgi:hypothetical protein
VPQSTRIGRPETPLGRRDKRMGVPSEFPRFPDENHRVLEPASSILWRETVVRWIDRWTRPWSDSGKTMVRGSALGQMGRSLCATGKIGNVLDRRHG